MVSMNETLSAVIDGEWVGDELALGLARMNQDAALRSVWDTYHLIGDALRGHTGGDVAARVGRRLAEEPTVLAPRSLRSSPRLAAWYAAAASVAAVALVAWIALPLMRPLPPMNAAAGAGAPILPVAATAPVSAPETATAVIEDYLLAHQQYSHTGASRRVEDSQAAPADLAKAGWTVRSAPAGFRTVNELTRTLGGTAGVGQIVLSDGAAAISVFIEPLSQAAPRPGLVRRGAINLYTRQLGNYWITVVGEAPADSVKYVAEAVEFRK
jgi:negative regulator of sigma E activity